MNNSKRKRRKAKLKIGGIILSIILLLVIVFGFYKLKDYVVEYISGSNPKDNIEQTSEKNADIDSKKYDYIIKNRSDINTGKLILVNNSIPYKFPKVSNVVSVYSKKNKSYKISEKSIALNADVIAHFNKMMSDFEKTENLHDIIINSAYRTKEEQEEILNEKIKQVGTVEAGKWATQPSNSEHHTGYAMDIGIYKDNGKPQSYTGSGKYGWINENCGNYGFILRYSGDKTEITGISNEPWHYRYVGVPHANIIKNRGLCLEEYIDYLKNYGFESKHLEVTDYDNSKYEIYYVKASMEKTSIPVPKNSEYSISGNNVDGFIVTIKK